jgi:hypothetical protein
VAAAPKACFQVSFAIVVPVAVSAIETSSTEAAGWAAACPSAPVRAGLASSHDSDNSEDALKQKPRTMASAAMRFASMMAELDDDDDVPSKPAESNQPLANPEPAAADTSPAQKPAETAASIVQRHQLEMAEVEEQCRAKLSESKKKNKMIREQAQAECEEMKRAIVIRHEQELTSLPSTELAIARQLASVSLNEEPAESNKSGFSYSAADGKKKGKQQKKKEARAEQEEKRYQEAKASMKDWVDPKEVEEKQLQAISHLPGAACNNSGSLVVSSRSSWTSLECACIRWTRTATACTFPGPHLSAAPALSCSARPC